MARGPQQFGAFAQELARRQLPPIYAASPNGSAFVARKKNGRLLATHVENGGLKIPTSVMILDQKNKAIRVVVDEDAITRH
jgi:hypothetical protein